MVPNFAELYKTMPAQLPAPTQFLIALGTTARSYVLVAFAALRGGDFRVSAVGRGRESGREAVDRMLLKMPVAGEVWLKYQVAQFSRVLGTLLVGGIPLMQALDTAADSLGTRVLKKVLEQASEGWCAKGNRCRSPCARPRCFPRFPWI